MSDQTKTYGIITVDRLLVGSDQPGPESRAQFIKTRRLEIHATLAEWKRAFFVDGIERPFADRVTLEAEDAALALEQRQISAVVEAAKVLRRKRERAALVEHLVALLRERGMDDVIAEAEKRASESADAAS